MLLYVVLCFYNLIATMKLIGSLILGPCQRMLVELFCYCFWLVHLSVHLSVHLLPVLFCGHSYSVIYHLISSKYHVWITFIKLSPKFKYEFCQMSNKQNGVQIVRRLSLCLCGHSNLVIYNRISSKFTTCNMDYFIC